MSEHRLYTYLLQVALTGGSITRSVAGDCTLAWMNETGGRSTLHPIVDVVGERATPENQEATWLLDSAKRMGVLVVDFSGCTFDDACHWVIKGPMMLEPGEKVNPLDEQLFRPGSSLSKMRTYDWCLMAAEKCPGIHISNIPAPDAVPGEHNIHLQEVTGVLRQPVHQSVDGGYDTGLAPRGWDSVETSHD